MSINLSIIIPVYNSEKYLFDCLHSVCKQIKKNTEIIVVDDCSSDNSVKISKKLKNKFKFLKIIRLKKNRGVSYCRNLGIKYAKGDYVHFLDSDDMLVNGSIKIILNKIKKLHDNDVFFIKNLILNNLKKKSKPVKDNSQIFNFKKNSSVFSGTLNLNEFRATCWNLIVKRSFLYKNNIAFRKLKTAEDWVFVSEVLCLLKNYNLIRKPLYVHRDFHFNTLGKEKGFDRAKSLLKVISALLVFINKKKSFLNKEKIHYLVRIINLATKELYLDLVICNKKNLKDLSLIFFKIKRSLSVLSGYKIQNLKFLSLNRKRLYNNLLRINKKKHNSLNLKINKTNNKNIIIFCAGRYGRTFLEYFTKVGLRIKVIVDNNPAYKNKMIYSLKIKTALHLKKNIKKFVKFSVFVCNDNTPDFKKIRSQLIKIGFPKSNIIHFI